MNNMPSQGVRWVRTVCACFLLGSASITTSVAQDRKVTQTAGVDNTNMGTYRALAQLSYQAFQKGDYATAAELARILERAWDKGEGDLAKSNAELYGQIDHAMDVFIKPVIGHAAKTPDPAEIQVAYNDYLEQLKRAE